MSQSRPIPDPAGDASSNWIAPDACMLPTAEQPVRVAEFTSLFADALTSIEWVSTTNARLALADNDDTAARAQDLATRETECCSFFTFAITSTSRVSAVMDVTVPEAHADVLAALVDMAEVANHRAAVGVDV